MDDAEFDKALYDLYVTHVCGLLYLCFFIQSIFPD